MTSGLQYYCVGGGASESHGLQYVCPTNTVAIVRTQRRDPLFIGLYIEEKHAKREGHAIPMIVILQQMLSSTLKFTLPMITEIA